MPLIGEVRAEGLTVREFEAAVEGRLRGDYLTDPQVSAEVTNFRPYYIYGEIASPGRYPYVDGMTVIKAVAIAGGFTPRSDTRVVFIQRADGAEEERMPLTPNTPVMPGDTVRLRERFF